MKVWALIASFTSALLAVIAGIPFAKWHNEIIPIVYRTLHVHNIVLHG